ncbi:MAG: hypothetical protein SOV26_00190 [Candidatus Onthovivens sp.]|nr:hypothetical protein [Candidatus Onthovivens sp.]
MNSELFKEFNKTVNKDFFVCDCYEKGEIIIFVEPLFYTQLDALISHYENKKEDIYNEILKDIYKYKKIVFVSDYDLPAYENYPSDFIIREIFDYTDRLGILGENLSRGSDYGD